MRIFRRHIGNRITLVMTSVLAVLLLSGSTWLNNRLDDIVRQWEIRQAQTHANTLLSTLQTLMLNGEGTLARQWIDRMHGVAGILDIEVLRHDGREAFTDLATVSAVNTYLGAARFERAPVAMRHRGDPPHSGALAQALRGDHGVDWSIPGRMTLYLPIPTRTECLTCHGYDQASLRGVLRLGLSTSDIEQWSEQLHHWSVGGIAVLLLMLSAAQLGAIRWGVLVPLARLRTAIAGMGEGSHAARLDFRREDEIGQVAAAFNRLQEQLRAITDNIPDAVLTCDRQGRIATVNRAVTALFGYDSRELLGKNTALLLPEMAQQAIDAWMRSRPGEPQSGGCWEIEAYRRDHSRVSVEMTLNRFLLQDQQRFIIVMRDISERKAQLAVIEHQALHDPLTNLPNRTLLMDRLRQAIRAAARSEESLALMILDLNRFKQINDTLGHLQGDRLLQLLAARLPLLLRASDTVARLGGDEFAIVLPGVDTTLAAALAGRITQSLEQPFELEERPYVIGTSIGIALFPPHGMDETTLLQHADTAMYAAKRRRIGHAFYDAEEDIQNGRELELLSDLRTAIGARQLMLHYQPKIDLSTRCVTGVEALVRWEHPCRGLIPPGDFIPVAEKYGITGVLTTWVIEEAMRQMYAWELDGIELGIAINLSMHDLENEQLIRHVERYRAENADARTHRLCLEVTETAMMSNPPRVIDTLHSLAEMGFVVSIDDFGTGYSSLNYLRQLPLSEIKIDKSFVMDMLRNKEAATIVRAVIDLAHNLGLRVVAEGVCEQDIYDRLIELGCDVAQGYFIARPMDANSLEVWLHSFRHTM